MENERLRKLLEKFGKERKQALPNQPVAQLLRDGWLDMFYYGVAGSESVVPSEQLQGAVKVSTLLRYSERTKAHFQHLADIVSAPKEFKITQFPGQSWEDDTPDGDIIYSQEHHMNFYEFTHDQRLPYIDPLMGIEDRVDRKTPELHVLLGQYRSGVWVLDYGLSYPSQTNVTDSDYIDVMYRNRNNNFAGSASHFHPERAHLLKYVFAPQPLSAQWFISQSYAPRIARHITVTADEKADKFRVINFGFNAEALANYLRKRDRPDPRPEIPYSTYSDQIYDLEKDGNREFSIVELGNIHVGDQDYRVYSGAEQPFVFDKKSWRSPYPQLVPAPI